MKLTGWASCILLAGLHHAVLALRVEQQPGPSQLRAAVPAVIHGAQKLWCSNPAAAATPAAAYNMHWRMMVPSILQALGPQGRTAGEFYQFGVQHGWSMVLLRPHFPMKKMWGFDSFQGLPEEQAALKHPAWGPGAYSSNGISPLTSPQIIAQLGGPQLAEMIPGFFKTSLTPALASQKRMQAAQYVDIDVDLYVSSVQALDWMFASGLVKPGTVVAYDDWWPVACIDFKTSPLQSGEGLAHAQIAEKYRVEFACVGGACSMPANFAQCSIYGSYAPIFLVVSIGESADTGFHMTDAERLVWMQSSVFCQQQHAQFGSYTTTAQPPVPYASTTL